MKYLLLILLFFAGCGDIVNTNKPQEDHLTGNSITLKIANGNIETYEYTSLSYSTVRGDILHINDSINYNIYDITAFWTSGSGGIISINLINFGNTTLDYTQLYYNDRTILCIAPFYYPIAQINNFNTYE